MNNWRKYNGALIPNTPPHIEVDVTNIEQKTQEEGVFFSRWVTNFDCSKETDFWYVICDKFIPIKYLSRNTRHNVKRGLKRCEVRKVSHQFIMDNAYDIYKKAFANYQGHLDACKKEEFLEEYSFYNNEDIWDFWAVFKKDTSDLIAFSRNKKEFNQCELCTTKFHPEYLRKYYPSEALFFTMIQYYLHENKYQYINDGARSISHETNIQSFLIDKFKFRKAYCKLNIIYSKKIQSLLFFIFPFRFLIKYINFGPFIKLNILIKQESIRRSYE